MKTIVLYCLFLLLFLNVFSQEEIFKMQKKETNHLTINKKYASDTIIELSDERIISSLSISGRIKLVDRQSLVRIILITEEHEYLVYEAYTLIAEKNEFYLDKVCEETSLLKEEKPLELILIVRNAEFHLTKIHFSAQDLNQKEKNEFAEKFHERKRGNEKYKTTQVNLNNSKNNKTWIADATEMSQLPFEEKMKLFGGNYDFLSGAFEYYQDGIFSFEDFEPAVKVNLKSITTSTYVSEFDWRDRHGQDWITSVKDQTGCGSCTAFAAIAATEAMLNIYHNNSNIDADLSEQEVWVCNSAGGSCEIGSQTYSKMYYIRDHGVSEEACFPYVAEDRSTLPCSNKCLYPNETVTIGEVNSVSNNSSSLKNALINMGPIASGFCNSGCCHAMALIGYKQLEVGDIIRYVINSYGIDSIIGSGNPLIGETCWIFKNSYGPNWNGGTTNGYVYIFFQTPSQISTGYTAETPTSSLAYSRQCTDNDNDGYYWWGIGDKPSTCPTCCPNEEDGDDSDSDYGPMDEYGNLTAISESYQYTSTEITSTETWTSDLSTCGDVVVTSTGNLTIDGAEISLEGSNSFEVEIGGELLITEGSIQ